MRLDLLRLSLIERQQLFSVGINDEVILPGEEIPTREAWLRHVFGRQFSFVHRHNVFHFAPEDRAATLDVQALIIGRVGRQVVSQENAPPSEGFADIERETWDAAYIFIDPRHHEDGQKVAFEHEPRVGIPAALSFSRCHLT